MKDNILLAAEILFKHRLNKTGLKSLPENLNPKTIEESYKIQNELKLLYLSLIDNTSIGKKIGCTNLVAQKQVGVYEPFYGNLFSKFHSISGCKLKASKFYKPYIEPEISFTLKNDININDAPFSFNDANFLFESIIPSIEIVDFRFGNNISEVGINNLIISNGASEYWIKSKSYFALNSVDLNNHVIKVFINDKIVEEGNTNMVLENPIHAAVWLINKLSYIGEPMLKGQYISTGTCTKAIPLKPNDKIVADFGTLGKVKISYF